MYRHLFFRFILCNWKVYSDLIEYRGIKNIELSDADYDAIL